jgi:hypothetical protein
MIGTPPVSLVTDVLIATDILADIWLTASLVHILAQRSWLACERTMHVQELQPTGQRNNACDSDARGKAPLLLGVMTTSQTGLWL